MAGQYKERLLGPTTQVPRLPDGHEVEDGGEDRSLHPWGGTQDVPGARLKEQGAHPETRKYDAILFN